MNLIYLDQVTSKYGKFRLSNYLKQSGRNYATFLIDFSKKDLKHIDGISDDDFKEQCKEGLNLNFKGIYALYGERHCKSSDNPIEVFMIEKDLWESDDEELKELLIFHEVCHLLEKRKYYSELEIKLSKHEIKVGAKLNEIANKIYNMSDHWGNDEDHNQEFGAILFHFLNKYDSENCYQLLARSMIKNFCDDYTQTFKEIEP